MRRVIVAVVLAAVTAGAVYLLAEATQNRPDTVAADSVGTVTFEVRTRRFPEAIDPGAALWAVCQATGSTSTIRFESPSEGRYVATISPALGKHSRRRMEGCLEDGTLDRVSGNVIAVEMVSAGGDPGAVSPG